MTLNSHLPTKHPATCVQEHSSVLCNFTWFKCRIVIGALGIFFFSNVTQFFHFPFCLYRFLFLPSFIIVLCLRENEAAEVFCLPYNKWRVKDATRLLPVLACLCHWCWSYAHAIFKWACGLASFQHPDSYFALLTLSIWSWPQCRPGVGQHSQVTLLQWKLFKDTIVVIYYSANPLK